MRKPIKVALTLSDQGAVYQSLLSVVLFLVLPILSAYYLFHVTGFLADKPPLYASLFIAFSASLLAVAGLYMFLKFPRNIGRLRDYINATLEGAPPSSIRLIGVKDSADLMQIQSGFQRVLSEMQDKLALLKDREMLEKELRSELSCLKKSLIDAEQQRMLIHHLAASCSQIDRSIVVLETRLQMMKHICKSSDERVQIAECEKELAPIIQAFDQLKVIRNLQSGPYIPADHTENIDRLAS